MYQTYAGELFMTEEDVKNWKVERDIARQSGKPDLVQKAYDHRDDLMMHCIQRQADRVKLLIENDKRTDAEMRDMRKDVSDIKTTVSNHEEVVSQLKKGRERAVGFWTALKVIGWIASVFGSAGVGWVVAVSQKAAEIGAK